MRTVSLTLVLVLSGIASGADKPAIDPVVAAAWAFSAPQPMPEAMPSYRLYQDSRGVWWQVPVQTPAVEVRAGSHFRQGQYSAPGTVAQTVPELSTQSPGTTVTGLIPMYAVPAGHPGNTSCTSYG